MKKAKASYWKPDPLAQSYFEKFLVRVDILPEFQKRKAYSDVIREGQEALELGIKGMLRSLGIEPSFSHDPGKELHAVLNRLPGKLSKIGPDLVQWSKQLRRQRELAYYGAADFIPTEEFNLQDGADVISFLQKAAEALKEEIK